MYPITNPIIAAIIIMLLLILPVSLNRKKQSKMNRKNSPSYWAEDLQKGLKPRKNSPTGKEYDWKLKETWEDYPFPDYDAYHTYCSISFDNSEKTFYYRTRNPELKVGDMVYVPVGNKYEKKAGRIVSMEDVLGKDAPYPLIKTKYIIEKVKK